MNIPTERLCVVLYGDRSRAADGRGARSIGLPVAGGTWGRRHSELRMADVAGERCTRSVVQANEVHLNLNVSRANLGGNRGMRRTL